MVEGSLLYRIIHTVCDTFPRTPFKILLSWDLTYLGVLRSVEW